MKRPLDSMELILMWLRKEFPYPRYRWQRNSRDGESAMYGIFLKIKRKPDYYFSSAKYHYYTFFRKLKNGDIECPYMRRNHMINLAYPNALKNLKRVVKRYADKFVREYQ